MLKQLSNYIPMKVLVLPAVPLKILAYNRHLLGSYVVRSQYLNIVGMYLHGLSLTELQARVLKQNSLVIFSKMELYNKP